MRRKAWNVLAAVAICGLMNAATADAIEGFSPVVYEESSYVNNEIASLRAEIDSLNLRMVSSVTSGYGDESKGGYGKSCGRGGGFSAGAELAFLKPYNGDGMGIVSVFALAGTANVGAVDTDFDAAPRVWLAYQNCDGLGVRVRYWQFDQVYTAPASGTTVFGAATGNAFHGYGNLGAECSPNGKESDLVNVSDELPESSVMRFGTC